MRNEINTVATRRGTNKVGEWTITKQLPHDVAPTKLVNGQSQNSCHTTWPQQFCWMEKSKMVKNNQTKD